LRKIGGNKRCVVGNGGFYEGYEEVEIEDLIQREMTLDS
jgi:hypothetical protein